VRKAGGRVRITAQLIDARDGYHLFSEAYDRGLEDIFKTQDEIARSIVARLETRLLEPRGGPATATRSLVAHHTHNTEAYTEYLKGLAHWRKWAPESARKAIEHYERSIEMDPHCALPHSGLATALTFLGALGHLPGGVAFPRATEAAHRALELEDSAGESHLALATVKLFYDWDFDAAYASFHKALSRTPGSSEVHHLYSLYLRAMGEYAAAAEEMEAAVQLDPLSPILQHSLGQAYLWVDRVDDAFRQVHRALDMDPDLRMASETLGWLHAAKGEWEEALSTFQNIVDRTGDPYKVIPNRAYCLAKLGRMDEARAMGELLERRRREHPDLSLEMDFALQHLAVGETDRTFEYLGRAVDRRVGAVVFLACAPMWGDIRSDPRFHAILTRVGLPVSVANP
jgi:tetratricopeptide (TPR) repeat protein